MIVENGVGGGGGNHARQQQQQPPSVKMVMPKINMGMSKEDEALMKKKLATMRENPAQMSNYNNFSPRAQRQKSSKYLEPATDSEDEDDGDGRKKSKFFKHTEKEREGERRRRRDERRRVKEEEEEDDEYRPDEHDEAGATNDRKRKHDDVDDEANSWLKRRRKDEPLSPAAALPDMDNFVPKKVHRTIERKLVPRIHKMDSESLMESSNYQRFNRSLETIFDNSEEVSFFILKIFHSFFPLHVSHYFMLLPSQLSTLESYHHHTEVLVRRDIFDSQFEN